MIPKKVKFTLGVLLICLVLIVRNYLYHEHYASSDTASANTSAIPATQPINLFSKLPSLIVPLTKRVRAWDALAPLVPFKAPLLVLTPPTKLANFLLYSPSQLTPVRNQGYCGACWAFSSTNMLADRLILSTRGQFHDNLSVQQFLSCFDRTGCDGGSPEMACLWLASTQKHLMSENADPYQQIDTNLVESKCLTVKSNRDSVGILPNRVFSIVSFIPEFSFNLTILAQNIQNMKAQLLMGGPFYCVITVYDDLFAFDGNGIYSTRVGAQKMGGHSIEIIGYCDSGVDPRPQYASSGYWVCKNSWGNNWPVGNSTAGIFAIKMGVNMCGVESRCGFADPVLYVGNTQREKRIERNVSGSSLKGFRYDSVEEYLTNE